MIEFEPFPKLARLSRECVITEKLDGTNAQVIIKKLETMEDHDGFSVSIPLGESDSWKIAGNILTGDIYAVAAGSRTRLIKPGKTSDNYGFAAFVFDHAEQLVQLGEGRHFGEWYGQGIQRNYGLTEKRFALFNTGRWFSDHNAADAGAGAVAPPTCCHVVPVLWRGTFDTNEAKHALGMLRCHGSRAVPGFRDPEGIVVYHSAAKVSFKYTYDDRHKESING